MQRIPEIIFDIHNSKITYKEGFMSLETSNNLYEYFLNKIVWEHDTAKIYGKTIVTKRKIAWFADSGFDYNYSGSSRIAQEWDSKVLEIRELLQKETGFVFNSCLLNLYHNGTEGMAWHSDDQNHLEPESPVAIISLGTERFFKFRLFKDRAINSKNLLQAGSLLLMFGETQRYFQHEVPKMVAVKTPRISLTFRIMKNK